MLVKILKWETLETVLSKHYWPTCPSTMPLHAYGIHKSRPQLPSQPPSITQIQDMTGSDGDSPPVNPETESKAKELSYNPHAVSSPRK